MRVRFAWSQRRKYTHCKIRLVVKIAIAILVLSLIRRLTEKGLPVVIICSLDNGWTTDSKNRQIILINQWRTEGSIPAASTIKLIDIK
jgi:hypothetical protein